MLVQEWKEVEEMQHQELLLRRRRRSRRRRNMFLTLLNYCQTVTAFLDYPSFPIGYYNSRFHDNEVWNPSAAEGYGYIPSFLR
jgi:hypothetical protein